MNNMNMNTVDKLELETLADNSYIPVLRSKVVLRPAIKPSMLSIARKGLSSANKGNPFWSKAEAMRSINACRQQVSA